MSPGARVLVVLAVLGVLLLVAVVAFALSSRSRDDTTGTSGSPQATTAATSGARPSEQQLRVWFVEHGWDAGSNYTYITGISWSGDTLVFATSLYADADARQPALWICGVGSQYLADNNRPQHVQVMDSAGQILTSRRGTNDRCAWRR